MCGGLRAREMLHKFCVANPWLISVLHSRKPRGHCHAGMRIHSFGISSVFVAAGSSQPADVP